MPGKRFYSITIFFIIVILVFSASIYASTKPEISAVTAVLLDGETGQVLYDKNMHIQRAPASTTKILTAIIAIEEGDLKEKVKVSRNAAYQEGSSIYLEPGEKITLEELVYGILLASGNDAAVAIAEHISGSIEEFSRLMNKRAIEMGARNSNFLNPNGLPQTGHLSTAYDLAVIMKYALQNEKFSQITATRHKTISWANKEWGRGLRNHNKLLWNYKYCTGGKTGFTKAAGRCLVASAEKEDRQVISVVLNSPVDWTDSRKLLDYGFDNFKKIKAVEAGELIYNLEWEQSLEKELQFIADNDIYVVIPDGGEVTINKRININNNLSLPVTKGQHTGWLTLSHNDIKIKKIKLFAGNNLNYSSLFMRFWNRMTQFIKNE